MNAVLWIARSGAKWRYLPAPYGRYETVKQHYYDWNSRGLFPVIIAIKEQMMRRKNERLTDDADRVVKDIKRQTRRRFSAEEKIRIVLAGLRGEDSIAELCRQEGIAQCHYYSWSKEFMEAGKKRLAGDTAREANTDEVKGLRREARDLKEVVAEQALELRLLKKSMTGDGEDIE